MHNIAHSMHHLTLDHSTSYLLPTNPSTTESAIISARDRLTGGVAVEGKAVLGAAGETGDHALGGESDEAGRESSRGDLALETQEVSSETSNVGRSHGGSRDGVLGALSVMWPRS